MEIRWMLVLPALLCVAATASGRTWRVERDGSGDFAVIQDAVDVAASGDTVRIGPGRYNERHLFTCPGWTDTVRVVVRQYELTIIGSGPETIIGPTRPWELGQGSHKGIVTGTLLGNAVLRVEFLRMENMYIGLYTSHTAPCTVEVRNCSFWANNGALWMSDSGGTARVIDCVFDRIPRDSVHVAAWGQSSFLMRGCVSRLLDYFDWPQSHVSLVGVQNAVIESCDLLEGAGGVDVAYGGQTTIRDCLFDGQRYIALNPSIMSRVSVYNCQFLGQENVIESYTSDNVVTLDSCVIDPVSDCSFLISHVGNITAHNCDLGRGARGVVWVEDRWEECDPVTLDMTDNYWGTDNPDSIRAWIRDRNDSEDACFYVDFEPFRNVSTPVQKATLSDIKALFRPGRQ